MRGLGLSLFAGGTFGRVIGIVAASIGALAALLAVGGAYPFWALGVFAICLICIHGLVVYGEPLDEEPRLPGSSDPTLGVPPHRERNHEAFYMLEGSLLVEVAGEPHELAPGDFLHIPPGVAHSLHNPGPDPARVLTIVSPGEGHARFFSTLGEPVEDPSAPPPPGEPPAFEGVQQIAAECGIEFLPAAQDRR